VDGSGAWCNHSGHIAISSKSLMTSTRIHMGGVGLFPFNVGWNVKWNRGMFYSNVSLDHVVLLLLLEV